MRGDDARENIFEFPELSRGPLKRRLSIEVAAEPTEPPRKLKHPAATLLAILDWLSTELHTPSLKEKGFQAFREACDLSEELAAATRDELATYMPASMPENISDKTALLEALSLSESEVSGLTLPVE